MGQYLSAAEVQRLQEAVASSRKRLEPFREARLAALRQYVGQHYGDDGTHDKVPLNLLELAVSVYTRRLAARNPRALVRTFQRTLKTSAAHLEMAVNHLIEEIRLIDTLRRAAMEAMFGLGVVKVGLNASATVELGGYLHDVGQPFADVVSLDDWVHDMNARALEECEFVGNRYRVSLNDLLESGLYDEAAVRRLAPREWQAFDGDGEARAESLSQGAGGERREFRDHVELYDLWLPRENLIVTLAEDLTGPTLREAEWNGPEEGPYHVLSFNEVPGNLMPLAPAAHLWMDLHTLANRLFNKLEKQALRQKTVYGAHAAATEDAERTIEAEDGEVIRLDTPTPVQGMPFPGIDQASLLFTVHVKDLATYLWGNLDALGGLGPQSATLGQDQLLQNNAGQRLEDMQDRMYGFTAHIVQALAQHLWTDPLIELPLVKRIEAFDVAIPYTWTPEDREGDFLQYNIEIEPYSMQHHSPSERLQTLVQVFQTFLAPFAPVMAQQGLGLDFRGLMGVLAKYTNMTELNELMTVVAPLAGAETPVGEPPRKLATTTRNYVRTSRAAPTNQSRDLALMQSLMGKSTPQQGRMAGSMAR